MTPEPPRVPANQNSKKDPAEEQIHDRLVARRLDIVDREGQSRLVLGVHEDGESSPCFNLLHADGRFAAIIQSDRDGNPSLALIDANGHPRVWIATDHEGNLELALIDTRGVRRVALSITADGETWDGERAVGRAGVVVTEPTGSPSAELFVTNDSFPDLEFDSVGMNPAGQ